MNVTDVLSNTTVGVQDDRRSVPAHAARFVVQYTAAGGHKA